MDDESASPAPKPAKRKKDARLSKDGNWRLFPAEKHLLQYVSTGMYFGRVKVGGKVIRRKLDTTVHTTAKLRLLDFLKEQRSRVNDQSIAAPTFGEAQKLFEADMDADATLSERTRAYKRNFVFKLIARTWPGIAGVPLNQLTPAAALEWSARLAQRVGAEAYNHTLGVWKNIFDRGAREYKTKGGTVLENPAVHVKRLGVRPKKLTLPEPEEFNALVHAVANAGSGFSAPCAELIQFLAYSGCRLSESGRFTWGDIDWNRNELLIHSAKQRGSDAHQPYRRVPIIPPMQVLLKSLKSVRKNEAASERVCRVRECQKALNTACSKLKIARITHHDLRHLFATRCIESGVDIPTVARWLGHKDGGALAMKTYGHLRNEHSQAMAAKVRF